MRFTRAEICQRQRDKKAAEELKELRGIYVNESDYEQFKADLKLVQAGKAKIIINEEK